MPGQALSIEGHHLLISLKLVRDLLMDSILLRTVINLSNLLRCNMKISMEVNPMGLHLQVHTGNNSSMEDRFSLIIPNRMLQEAR